MVNIILIRSNVERLTLSVLSGFRRHLQDLLHFPRPLIRRNSHLHIAKFKAHSMCVIYSESSQKRIQNSDQLIAIFIF